MPTLLKNLMLEELSLVDRPANAQAMVSLFKRDNSYEKDVDKMDMEMEAKVKAYMEENGVDREAAMKACGYKDTMKEDSTEELDALKADIATLKAENEFLRKGFH
jgi:hypothetical protein